MPEYCILKKVFIYQEDMRTVNAYVLSNSATIYMRQKLTELKGEIDKPTNRVENISNPLSIIDNQTEIIKDIALNNTINQQDLTNIYRTLHPTTAEYPMD